jgi:hypothetical protein
MRFVGIALLFATAAVSCGPRRSPGSGQRSIRMILATYGYNCGAPPGNALASVRKACEGNLNCEYKVAPSQLGDPTPGCNKDFMVNYVCLDGARERRVVVDAEAAGRVVSLTCE